MVNVTLVLSVTVTPNRLCSALRLTRCSRSLYMEHGQAFDRLARHSRYNSGHVFRLQCCIASTSFAVGSIVIFMTDYWTGSPNLNFNK